MLYGESSMEGKSMYAMYLRKSRQDMELELLGQGLAGEIGAPAGL